MSPNYAATGFQMIRSIDVRNFRCYRSLSLEVSGRLALAAGCAQDPFVFLGKVFREHPALIPMTHNSLDPIAAVLNGIP